MNENKQKKICMVIDREHSQSESQLLIDLATNLDNDKYLVEILTTGESWLASKLADMKFTVRAFQTSGIGFGRIKKIAQLLTENNYDIVHTFGAEANNFVRYACAKVGVKIISSINHIYEIDEKPFYKNLKSNSSKTENSTIVFPTETLKNNFASQSFSAKYKSKVIRVGVDTDLFETNGAARENARWDLELYSNQTAVFFIGELSENSGIGTFLKMASKLLSDEFSPNFFIVGKGPQERLVNRFCMRNRSSDVKYLGVESSIERYYQAADICVVPRKAEDSNLEILQALSCEVPVVASRFPGVEEVIESGKTGLLAPAEDPEGFARAVRALVNNEIMRKVMSENSHEKIVENYNISKTITEYEALYNEE